MSNTFHGSISYNKVNRSANIVAPVALARSLQERGYNRCKFTVTEAGILLRPYKDDARGSSLQLPQWDHPGEKEEQ